MDPKDAGLMSSPTLYGDVNSQENKYMKAHAEFRDHDNNE